ncbi:hypothetical protein [Candidatus Frankia alpina]|uniref:hypothetical protein n=1 Tax=Candidatus Frankia alpina TaxID=2699483 RepID=UPI0013D1C601|nr:hypothetical protein [Candidatus Frankia alpina]
MAAAARRDPLSQPATTAHPARRPGYVRTALGDDLLDDEKFAWDCRVRRSKE